MVATASEAAGIRLDVWLWAARWFKTRALAKQAIASGKVEIAGAPAKAARLLRIGDGLKICREHEHYDIVVIGLDHRRGPALQAETLYIESAESVARREALREQRKFDRLGMQPPEHKPDKRARRLIRALGDLDAL
ncbi:MAG: RNA-binding protein [Lysobacterales bacterium CG02_land_8_20_14_3_00_62_12]|nr:MAG: RNA-binding protein [Xanthomonadales bacterium CG02_land_8_20_14_3_00_62_12]